MTNLPHLVGGEASEDRRAKTARAVSICGAARHYEIEASGDPELFKCLFQKSLEPRRVGWQLFQDKPLVFFEIVPMIANV